MISVRALSLRILLLLLRFIMFVCVPMPNRMSCSCSIIIVGVLRFKRLLAVSLFALFILLSSLVLLPTLPFLLSAHHPSYVQSSYTLVYCTIGAPTAALGCYRT